MKTTREMIQDSQLWAGLNVPGCPPKDADVIVYGIAYDGGASFRAGAAQAPAAVRSITYTIDPNTETFESFAGLKVLDLGDTGGADREAIFAQAEKWARGAVSAGKLLTVIGGDHSVTIPILKGVDAALDGPLGIVHLDAHFDLCPEMSGNPLAHGCTQRRSLELANVDSIDHIYFVGLRSIEDAELPFFRENKLNLLSMEELARTPLDIAVKRIVAKMMRFKYVYITVDIDVLDPGFAPGTGTPQFGGMDPRQLLTILKGLFVLPVVGFDVVEVAPPLDHSAITSFAARKIITECWGQYFKKIRRG
jgi:agmatinase